MESPSIIKRTKDIRPRATIKANPEDLRLRKIGVFLDTFFLEKKCSKIKLKNRNSIVVVHSYGLHYFLKKRVRMRILIIGFGSIGKRHYENFSKFSEVKVFDNKKRPQK